MEKNCEQEDGKTRYDKIWTDSLSHIGHWLQFSETFAWGQSTHTLRYCCFPLTSDCFKQNEKKRTRGEGTGYSSWHSAKILGFYYLDKKRKI